MYYSYMKNVQSGARASATAKDGGAVMFDLIKAAHALEDRLEKGLGQVGLSMPKFSVLSALATADTPLSLSELAARLACVRSNMTQLVDRLEADGLVRRTDDPSDRRTVRAALTPLGSERCKAGGEAVTRVQAEFAASLPQPELTALDQALESLR
jgi:DNA-binding MarR family transcriptional regulator